MLGELSDEELYAKFGDRLVRFASTIVGPAHAEDIMTDGVVSAMNSRNWGRVDDRVSYLYRSVLNAGRMHLRSSKRRAGRESIVARRETRTHEWETIGTEPALEVRAAVASLSARQRAVIYLTYWEDLDERTTARRMGIAVGSVRRHLSRARTNVGRKLHDEV